ncbi:MAG: DNA-binding response regulator [Flexibacter sp. CG_4_10_14_3_um_filter_32_15]|nr:MAG: DNA-binding response regulator [Flexibacter sp. CG_4_10_14_3_um_filter_32_15]
MQKIRILTVEDELIIAQDLEEILEELGYDVIENVRDADAAIHAIKKNNPDLVLLDFRLAKQSTGAEVAQFIRDEKLPIPFIFLTSHADPKTVSVATQTMPYGYIMKPFEAQSLYAAIEVALINYSKLHADSKNNLEKISEQEGVLFNDCLFVKYRNQFIKVAIHKIEWLSAENNYTTIHTQNRKYIIRNSLTNVLEIINKKEFLRVHRSYAVNVSKIDVIERTKLIIDEQEIPIGRSYQQEIISQIKILTGE